MELKSSSTIWQQEGPDEIGNVVVEYVASRQSDGRVALGTHGRGVFIGDPSSTVDVTVLSIREQPDVFSLAPNYPNPFNLSTTIRFYVPSAERVVLTVYDLLGKKIYWTDSSLGRIYRSDLDGKDIQLLVTSKGPDAIALDVAGSKMYWTTGDEGRIHRSDLDGRRIEHLVSVSFEGPSGIALDVGEGKMYWTVFGAGKIQRADLDGENVEDVITGLDEPDAISIHGKTGSRLKY